MTNKVKEAVERLEQNLGSMAYTTGSTVWLQFLNDIVTLIIYAKGKRRKRV